MKKFIVSALIITLSFLLKSCNTTDPPPPPNGEKATLELTLEDVSCIEAWITLTTTNLQLPATITLKQYKPTGDTVTQNIILSNTDSLLYIDSLLPNQTYLFHTTIQSSNHTSEAKSNLLDVTTMDTTSHNFTFQSWTFGTIGSSRLYDVAIISPDNIWCVGEILVADTSQNGYTTYNAVHWDGVEWKLYQIMFYTICGQQSRTAYPASSIFAFSENDVWISMDGDQVARLSGTTQVATYCLPISFSINKLWGDTPNSLYAVGDMGNIYFYNGTRWTHIESGTDLNIGDIWGITDGIGGYNKYLAADNAMLKIDANNNLSRIDAESGMFIHSVWGISNRLIYTAGEGVVLYKNYNWEKIDRSDVNTIYVIKGQNYNDVFGLSAARTILHYNGFSWGSINVPTTDVFYKLNVRDNITVAVGRRNNEATVTIIRRNN